MKNKTVTIYEKELSPVNKQASLIIQPSKLARDDAEFKNKSSDKIFDGCPFVYDKVPKNIVSLVGTRRGKVVLVGFHSSGKSRKENDSNNGKWVGKCDCGNFVIRNGKAWRGGLRNNIEDEGCARCNSVKNMIRHEEWAAKHEGAR